MLCSGSACLSHSTGEGSHFEHPQHHWQGTEEVCNTAQTSLSFSQFKMYLYMYYHACCVFWHVIWQTAKLRRTTQMSAGYSHNAMCNWFLQGHVFWGNVLCEQRNGFLTRLSTYLKVKTKKTEGTYFSYVPTDFTYQMIKVCMSLNSHSIKLSVTSLFCPQEKSPPASNFQVPYNKPM